MADVKLLDHFAHAGDAFFRHRSYLPLLLLPAFALALRAGASQTGGWTLACQVLGLIVSLVGLGVRVYTIGSAPPGTSERSTTDPRASLLNTAGAYSVVRHPLYLGNTLVALGLGLFTVTWFLPVIVLLASLLYHERICAREEVFLESEFGEAFRAWANQVPALVPALGRYRRAGRPFRWKKVLAREFHALFVIGAGFFVLDGVRQVFATGTFAPDRIWTFVCAATGAVFVLLTVLKKLTRVLDVEEARIE